MVHALAAQQSALGVAADEKCRLAPSDAERGRTGPKCGFGKTLSADGAPHSVRPLVRLSARTAAVQGLTEH
ncbi:hypothetical protein FA09DRAFT_332080 [Tilletiopsis washingtonensis]|uniref:Uncharacterized protein n=1 Tax=Tilletiopsis washingtonensis TaxID=58919 RepID=A0A316Z0Y1_9BASI|nr:hypothetical protein FA09DRAFT_332080 [Tilletiopsis washingtonensis]PWN95427.1 hypothetical protein FA09DRAFT_332080 [Tilletiopsis washingtonensis]